MAKLSGDRIPFEHIANVLKKSLEARGEYFVRANAESGWFAMFPPTWAKRSKVAVADGREGPNLVVSRTKSDDLRDHYVIPHAILRELLDDTTLTTSKVNGVARWNLTLKDGKLHVTHRTGSVDVSRYHGAPLLGENAAAADFATGSQVAAQRPVTATAEEVEANADYLEGAVRQILVNAYERNTEARAKCLLHYGAKCVVCGFDFGAKYGSAAAGFIHVHHVVPISSVGTEYRLDPIEDLRPICPNCHAVVHRRQLPYGIEEVRAMLRENDRGLAE